MLFSAVEAPRSLIFGHEVTLVLQQLQCTGNVRRMLLTSGMAVKARWSSILIILIIYYLSGRPLAGVKPRTLIPHENNT